MKNKLPDIIFTAAFLVFMVCPVFMARGMRNPFLTPVEEEALTAVTREVIDYMKINGLFYAPGRSYAVVDGRMIREGEAVDGLTVIEINPGAVILSDGYNHEFIIKVKNVISTGS